MTRTHGGRRQTGRVCAPMWPNAERSIVQAGCSRQDLWTRTRMRCSAKPRYEEQEQRSAGAGYMEIAAARRRDPLVRAGLRGRSDDELLSCSDGSAGTTRVVMGRRRSR